jgi:hypothetical protein
MQTSAKIIADSVHNGHRLTTMEVTLHRFVLAEFNTHRVFSRNSASSRAIPVEKQLTKVLEHPAWPLEWPSEQPGMQGGTHLEGEDLDVANEFFKIAHEMATASVQAYLDLMKEEYGEDWKAHTLHKSLINRVLEPFMWHTIIVTSTEWDNFFAQRCSPLAQPEIRTAAELMQAAYRDSEPQPLGENDWHLPYVQPDELGVYVVDHKNAQTTITEGYELLVKLSAARCARVSYLTQDGIRDWDKDFELYERLVSADPPHWSPLEHVARPVKSEPSVEAGIQLPGNFTGWVQLRHIIDPKFDWIKE